MMFFRKLLVAYVAILVPSVAVAQETWSLDKAVRRAKEVSPKIGIADAEIQVAEGDVIKSEAWPNPQVQVGASNGPAAEEGDTGVDISSISISQALPIGRLSRQSKVANAELTAAREDRRYQELLLENSVARSFHTLQTLEAKFKLAEDQLKFATRSQKGRSGKDPLVRYLSQLDKKRLSIVKELAAQKVAAADGELSEAQMGIRAMLQLPADRTFRTEVLAPPKVKASLDVLAKGQLSRHAAAAALRSRKAAAEAEIEVARGRRYSDPTVSVFREQGFLTGKGNKVTGVMLGIGVPIWDFNDGEMVRSAAQAKKAAYELQGLSVELDSKLRQSYLHMGHLVEQAEHYREKVLEPAEDVYKLTNQSFVAGEVNVLSLVDASDTYFVAQEHYLDLLSAAWLEYAELRLASGLTLTEAAKGLSGLDARGNK